MTYHCLCPFCNSASDSEDKYKFRCQYCETGISFDDSGNITLITYTLEDPDDKFFALQFYKTNKKFTLWMCSTRTEVRLPPTYVDIENLDIEPPKPHEALALTRRLYNLLAFT